MHQRTTATHLSSKSVQRRVRGSQTKPAKRFVWGKVPRVGVVIYDEHETELVSWLGTRSLGQRRALVGFEKGDA